MTYASEWHSAVVSQIDPPEPSWRALLLNRRSRPRASLPNLPEENLSASHWRALFSFCSYPTAFAYLAQLSVADFGLLAQGRVSSQNLIVKISHRGFYHLQALQGIFYRFYGLEAYPGDVGHYHLI
ncbi:hypothetical protein HKBW3S33_01160 [Candidatus Hakubella thermalkaliphila]|uniref:Uncharacterized protein n=1 Tax=Candidatus Hakubella thermalkaliphila TaxID=2754717 RepID=A0A6V8P6Z9_9ACTN|nr:hypothetical protein HKBW3S33_01160 [Candidatus Hakubella thermalkaliphila]